MDSERFPLSTSIEGVTIEDTSEDKISESSLYFETSNGIAFSRSARAAMEGLL